MKTIKLTFFAAMSLLVFHSCEKSSTYSSGIGAKTNISNTSNGTDLATSSRIALLTAKPWRLTKIMSGNTNIIQLCELDNEDVYNKAGFLTSHSNQLCPTESQSIYNKTWRLKNHTEILEIIDNSSPSAIIDYTILKIDANSLILKGANSNTYVYSNN